MFSRILIAGASAALLTLAAPSANAATILGSDITTQKVQATYGDGFNTSGGEIWTITGGDSVFALCAQYFLSGNLAPSYTVTDGFTYFNNSFFDTRVTAFLSNAFPLLNNAIAAYTAANGSLTYNAGMAAQWQTIGSLSFAMQEMTWGLMEQFEPTFDPYATGRVHFDIPGMEEGSAYMVDWSNKLNDGTWQVNDAVRIRFASASNNTQDRIWLDMTSAVPEPATWAMMMIGFGAVGLSLRRRSALTAVQFS